MSINNGSLVVLCYSELTFVHLPMARKYRPVWKEGGDSKPMEKVKIMQNNKLQEVITYTGREAKRNISEWSFTNCVHSSGKNIQNVQGKFWRNHGFSPPGLEPRTFAWGQRCFNHSAMVCLSTQQRPIFRLRNSHFLWFHIFGWDRTPTPPTHKGSRSVRRKNFRRVTFHCRGTVKNRVDGWPILDRPTSSICCLGNYQL